MDLKRQTLLYVFRSDGGGHREVLLGEKLSGFGRGMIMGLGGHVEHGESDLEAAVREAHEEAHIVVPPESAIRVATLTYRFPTQPAWDAVVTVFLGPSWFGEVAPSEELSPIWFPVSNLPLDRMWDDERYWLPHVLAGKNLVADFTFDESCSAVQEHSVVEGKPE